MKRLLMLFLFVSVAEAQVTPIQWGKISGYDTVRMPGISYGIRTNFVTFPDGSKITSASLFPDTAGYMHYYDSVKTDGSAWSKQWWVKDQIRDSLIEYTPRTVQAADSTYRAAQLLLRILYSDTTSSIAKQWWVKDQIKDSLAEYVLRANGTLTGTTSAAAIVPSGTSGQMGWFTKPAGWNYLTTATITDSVALSSIISQRVSTDSDFVIVILPDPQFYGLYGQGPRFKQMTEWVITNKTALNIKAVIGVGDYVNTAGDAEYRAADTAFAVLDAANCPYVIPPGNHDYNTISNRTDTTYNRYFPITRFSSQSWYGSTNYPTGRNDNSYVTFSVGSQLYLVIALELYPRDAALAWAQGIINANPTAKIIIATHAYLTTFGRRALDGDPYGPAAYSLTADNNGQELWDNFLKINPQIILIVSGHFGKNAQSVYGLAERMTSIGNAGNLVHEIVANYQEEEPPAGITGCNGYIRIMTFHPSLGTLQVQTYSPPDDAYKTDTQNAFTLSYPENRILNNLGIVGNLNVSNTLTIDGDALFGKNIRLGTPTAYGNVYSPTFTGLTDISADTNYFDISPPDYGTVRFGYRHGGKGVDSLLHLYGGAYFNGGLKITGRGLVQDGTTALPAYSFTSDPGAGISLSSGVNLGFSIGGIRHWFVNGWGSNVGGFFPSGNDVVDIGDATHLVKKIYADTVAVAKLSVTKVVSSVTPMESDSYNLGTSSLRWYSAGIGTGGINSVGGITVTSGNAVLSGYTVTTDVRASDSVASATGTFSGTVSISAAPTTTSQLAVKGLATKANIAEFYRSAVAATPVSKIDTLGYMYASKFLTDSAMYGSVYISDDHPDTIAFPAWANGILTIGALSGVDPRGYPFKTGGVSQNLTLQDSSLTIGVDGNAEVSYSMTIEGITGVAIGAKFNSYIYVNDVKQEKTGCMLKMQSATACQNLTCTPMTLSLKKNDIVKLKLINVDDANGNTVIVQYARVHIIRHAIGNL